MKRLNHKFISRYNSIINDKYGGLIKTDKCIFCEKTVNELEENLNYNFHTLKVINQIDFLNENSPCITEDEYIIKNIIE